MQISPSIAWESWAKENKITASLFSFTQQTSPLSGCIQNLNTMAVTVGENEVVDVYKKERKMNINDNDKQEDVNSVHNASETNVSEARWVPEKSLTQIYICITLE